MFKNVSYGFKPCSCSKSHQVSCSFVKPFLMSLSFLTCFAITCHSAMNLSFTVLQTNFCSNYAKVVLPLTAISRTKFWFSLVLVWV